MGGGCYQDWVQSTSGCSLDRVQQSTKSGCRKGPDDHLQQDYPGSCKQNHPEIKQTRLFFLLQNKQFASLLRADKTENNEIHWMELYLFMESLTSATTQYVNKKFRCWKRKCFEVAVQNKLASLDPLLISPAGSAGHKIAQIVQHCTVRPLSIARY